MPTITWKKPAPDSEMEKETLNGKIMNCPAAQMNRDFRFDPTGNRGSINDKL
jgi:hypothetical protein